MANKTLIILNGPPRSGKDFAADWIVRNYEGIKIPTAKILKEKTHQFFDLVDMSGLPLPYNYFESVKEKPSEKFAGMSPRQAYIWMSEEVMKPKLGAKYFGMKLMEDIVLNWHVLPSTVIISDCGFISEIEGLAEYARVLARSGRLAKFHRIVFVRLHADGCTFEGDSRSYVYLNQDLREALRKLTAEGLFETNLRNPKTPIFIEALQRICEDHI